MMLFMLLVDQVAVSLRASMKLCFKCKISMSFLFALLAELVSSNLSHFGPFNIRIGGLTSLNITQCFL